MDRVPEELGGSVETLAPTLPEEEVNQPDAAFVALVEHREQIPDQRLVVRVTHSAAGDG